MSSNEQSNPRITVVGYGSQGRAHAMNLRDSGFDVTVGLRPGGPTEVQAKADGFEVRAPADAVRDADLVAVLTPDMVQKKLYEEVLAPNMKQGAVLLFALASIAAYFGLRYGIDYGKDEEPLLKRVHLELALGAHVLLAVGIAGGITGLSSLLKPDR